MTRPHSDALKAALRGSFQRRLIVDVYHGSERVAQDLAGSAWSFDGDLYAEVKHSGTMTITHQAIAGESLVPEGLEGTLAPLRAKLLLLMEISAGEFSETVTLGVVRVDRIVDAYDRTATIGDREVVVASVVRLDFVSLEDDVAGAGFHSPEQAPSTASAFDELRRILDLPVVENVPDKAIPAATAYEARHGGRLKAAQQLSAILGGIGVVSPTGVWTIVPDVPTGPALELALGEDGTVVDVPFAIDTKDVYTTVVGNFETADRKPIYSKKTFPSGPLADRSLIPDRVKYVTSDQVRTQAAADEFVQAQLQASLIHRYQAPVQCVVNPLVELGDPAEVIGHTRALTGRVVKYALSESALMTITLEASREL